MAYSQKHELKIDSLHELQEVVVTGFQPNNARYISLNIEPYALNEINEKAPVNLSDALSKLPGISQITTGNAISKPVKRFIWQQNFSIAWRTTV